MQRIWKAALVKTTSDDIFFFTLHCGCDMSFWLPVRDQAACLECWPVSFPRQQLTPFWPCFPKPCSELSLPPLSFSPLIKRAMILQAWTHQRRPWSTFHFYPHCKTATKKQVREIRTRVYSLIFTSSTDHKLLTSFLGFMLEAWFWTIDSCASVTAEKIRSLGEDWWAKKCSAGTWSLNVYLNAIQIPFS